jgi:hypothetical protein
MQETDKEKLNTIQVVLRTRPTQNFASRNITLDNLENVYTSFT